MRDAPWSQMASSDRVAGIRKGQAMFEYGVDTIVFIGIEGLGFVLLVASFLAGNLFDFFQSDLDAGGGHAADAGSLVNTQGVLGLMTGFGATGWVLTGYFGINPMVAALLGLVGGLLVMVPATMLYNGLQKQSGGSSYSEADVIGMTALVSLAILANGMGRIQFTKGGTLNSGAARSSNGVPIRQVEQVRVEQTVGGVFLVREITEQPPAAAPRGI
ncbi:MAG: hypothetical protein FJ318_02745 [SAR202 cluster bacterium]|nr:hypothetical protein [SAR202 cluster bacterium]